MEKGDVRGSVPEVLHQHVVDIDDVADAAPEIVLGAGVVVDADEERTFGHAVSFLSRGRAGGAGYRVSGGRINEGDCRPTECRLPRGHVPSNDQAMSTVEEIEAAIARLSRKDLMRLRSWLEDHEAEVWDSKLDEDVRLGRLDEFADKAAAAFRQGKCTRLWGTTPPRSSGRHSTHFQSPYSGPLGRPSP